MSDVKRPAIRWHGGKWNLAPWIISHFPEHRIYVEPFGGGGSVLLRKPRSYAEVYNDLDGVIVNLFQVLRDQPDELLRRIRLTPFARGEFESAPTDNDHPDPIERARMLLIRGFMGFGTNGHNRSTGFRANSNRSGTTPAHDWANWPKEAPALVERLKSVVIENRDAVHVMEQHDSTETLHYLDPPYMPETRDSGYDYSHEMTVEDHEKLLIYAQHLEGNVAISGYRSELYDDLLDGWGWTRIDVNALADGARKRTECLWLSYEPPQARLFA